MVKVTAAEVRLEQQFARAAARGECMVPVTDADRVALNRRVQKGEVIAVTNGVYDRPDHWLGLSPNEKALHLMRALAKKHPTWVFRGSSAALAWGLQVPYSIALPVKVYAGHVPHEQGPYLEIHEAPRTPREPCVGRVNGVQAVDLAEAALESMLAVEFPDGLAIADSAIRALEWTRDELLEYVETAGRNRRGVRRALMIAQHADGRAENGGESKMRAFLIVRGFQLPELQVEVSDPLDPSRTFRVDFIWYLPDGRVVIGEFDGRIKYENERILRGRPAKEVILEEKDRESRLTWGRDASIVRLNWDDFKQPGTLQQKLEMAGVPRSQEACRLWHERWAAACAGSAGTAGRAG